MSKFFSKPAKFLFSASEFSAARNCILPEVAFLGRSNVGKSSIINFITNIKSLSRISKTPGRTRELLFFGINDQLIIADTPGYGYSKVSYYTANQWKKLIYDYICHRNNLKRIVLLIDSRRGIKDIDKSLMDDLEEIGCSYQIVYTKVDKITSQEKQNLVDEMKFYLNNYTAMYPEYIFTSSKNGTGLDQLRGAVYSVI